MSANSDIRVVELFAGVGGFRVGLERCSERFKTIWANQWEPGQAGQWAYKCYSKNFGEDSHCVNADIATVIDQVPPHDLLVGGFPCQDYSVASTGAKGIEGKDESAPSALHPAVIGSIDNAPFDTIAFFL